MKIATSIEEGVADALAFVAEKPVGEDPLEVQEWIWNDREVLVSFGHHDPETFLTECLAWDCGTQKEFHRLWVRHSDAGEIDERWECCEEGDPGARPLTLGFAGFGE